MEVFGAAWNVIPKMLNPHLLHTIQLQNLKLIQLRDCHCRLGNEDPIILPWHIRRIKTRSQRPELLLCQQILLQSVTCGVLKLATELSLCSCHPILKSFVLDCIFHPDYFNWFASQLLFLFLAV